MRVAALIGSILVTCVWGMSTAAAQTDPWAEPVAEFDHPDPDLVIDDTGRWFAFATGGGWFTPGPSTNIPLATSDDQGATWTRVGDALPEVGTWASRAFTWAPSLLEIDGTWVMYYSAPVLGTGRKCIGRATSPTLFGPFVDRHPGPIVCQPELGGSIDPEAFRDGDGTLWLLWKNDGNAIGAASFIWSQPLTGDGTALAGRPTRLLGVTQDWEEGVIEHPAAIVDDELWLLYSAGPGYWDAGYATGVARCAHPTGPCSRASRPLLSSDVSRNLIGPGAAHAATDANGARWMLHHGWNPERTERWLYRRPLTVGGGVATSGPLSVRVGPPTGPRFADVSPSAFYGAAVEWADRLGITTGTSATTFSPARFVTRGELATFLHRSVGSPPAGQPSPFVDVPAGAFYARAVAWMSEVGVTTGTSPTTFSPGRPTTRAEAVTFLNRLALL